MTNNTTAVPEAMAEKELNKAGFGAELIQRQDSALIDPDQLRAITSWDDIQGIIENSVYADEVIGDGFDVLSGDDKAQLVGTPLVFLQWRFANGKDGFLVIIDAIQKTGVGNTDMRKVRIIDFSAKSGLCQELRDYSAKTGSFAGLVVRNGLRASTYNFEDANTGENRVATTYYIDKSK